MRNNKFGQLSIVELLGSRLSRTRRWSQWIHRISDENSYKAWSETGLAVF